MTHTRTVAATLALAAALSSCDFESDDLIFDQRTEAYEKYDYYIDQYGNEGIVVSVGNSLGWYSIVVSADEAELAWGPTGETVYTAEYENNYFLSKNDFGMAMLQMMSAKGIERYPAAAWCNSKNHGETVSASSWRLPSYYELKTYITSSVYLKHINEALEAMGGTPIEKNAIYWTCTEDFDGYVKFKEAEADYDMANRAVILTPSREEYTDKDRWLKKNRYRVRAIKYLHFSRL